MAVFGAIPLPQSGGEVFKDVMDYFEQLQKRKTQMQEFSQQLATQKEQFAKNYALRQQAEARAQSLLPYAIQQYKDAHGKAAAEADIQKMYRDLLSGALSDTSQTTTGMPSPAAPGSAPSPGTTPQTQPLADEHRQQLQNFLAQNPDLPQDQKQQITQFLQTAGQSAPQATPMPSPGAMGQETPISQGAAAPILSHEALPIGQEMTLREGNPALSKLDRVAGIMKGIPAPQVHYTPSGMVITRYPSGRMTVQNMGSVPGGKTVAQETPEERQKREVETAEKKERSKADVKKEEEYLAAGDIVNKYAGNLETISNLLNKSHQTVGGLTGNIAGMRNMLHLTNEDQGSFNAATLPLVGKLAKDISQRGGAVAAGLAQAGKPGIWQSHDANVGLTKRLIEESIDTFDNAKREYEALTGKPYPKKMPKFLQKYKSQMSGKNPPGTVVMYKKGIEYHIPEGSASAAEKKGYSYAR